MKKYKSSQCVGRPPRRGMIGDGPDRPVRFRSEVARHARCVRAANIPVNASAAPGGEEGAVAGGLHRGFEPEAERLDRPANPRPRGKRGWPIGDQSATPGSAVLSYFLSVLGGLAAGLAAVVFLASAFFFFFLMSFGALSPMLVPFRESG